jgi:hypothetical protein
LQVSAPDRRPTIVYIMADDLGYADLSGYGRTDYSTPALDRLASEGTHADGYLTDIFTDQAEVFLRSAKPPFFLNLEYSAPHWPWQQRGDPPYPDDKDPISRSVPVLRCDRTRAAGSCPR